MPSWKSSRRRVKAEGGQVAKPEPDEGEDEGNEDDDKSEGDAESGGSGDAKSSGGSNKRLWRRRDERTPPRRTTRTPPSPWLRSPGRRREGCLVRVGQVLRQAPGAGGGTGDCRREKSLGLLSQKFVQLFLVSRARVVSLESAARTLLGSCADQAKLKTKVRRLYDIANILSSLRLIEKTHLVDSRKPAFRWLGVEKELAALQAAAAGAGVKTRHPAAAPPPPPRMRSPAATSGPSSPAPGRPRTTPSGSCPTSGRAR